MTLMVAQQVPNFTGNLKIVLSGANGNDDFAQRNSDVNSKDFITRIYFRVMNQRSPIRQNVPAPRTWDARLARRLVTPLIDTRITPNHLTTLRLLIGLAGALCLARGDFAWSNAGALLIVLSNFVDHTDGELARISGKTSRIGHFYDLASDALVTVLLFLGMGIGMGAIGGHGRDLIVPSALLGGIAGVSVAVIFFLRMRIEEMAGKAGTKQASAGGFETEDVLYLLPLVTLTSGTSLFIIAASIGAPLFAVWVMFDYRRVARRAQPDAQASQVWVSR
ncbi:archaetidylinositol phosphate synthase [Paraburkholderia sp. GAS334]